MERNIVTDVVVPSTSSLEDKEGYAVGVDGVLTASTGDFVYGIIRSGRPAGEATEIITSGECEARVNGGSTLSAETPLTGGASGKLVEATIGTHLVRAILLEQATADSTYQVLLI